MVPLWLSGSRYLQIILANIFNGERSISNLAFDWNLMYFYKTKICSLPETVHWLIAFISVWKSPMEWLVDSWTDYSCQTRNYWKMINSILNRWRWQRICFTFIYCVKRYWEQWPMYLWKQFGISIQIRIVPYHPYNYLCSRVQNQCQMRHLASKAKYLASKSLALAHSGLVTGQGWEMQPTSFANPPFYLFMLQTQTGWFLQNQSPASQIDFQITAANKRYVSVKSNSFSVNTEFGQSDEFSLFLFQFLWPLIVCLSPKVRSWILITSQLFQ